MAGVQGRDRTARLAILSSGRFIRTLIEYSERAVQITVTPQVFPIFYLVLPT